MTGEGPGLGTGPVVNTPSLATAAGWEFDVGALPAFVPEQSDSLLVGILPEPLRPGSDVQQMLLSDQMSVDEDIMVGASIGVVQLASVGLVVLHRWCTSLMASRAAWAVGIRLRRARLAAGEMPYVVMAGSKPSADMIPEGVTFTTHVARVRDHEIVSPIIVWEVEFPAFLIGVMEESTPL